MNVARVVGESIFSALLAPVETERFPPRQTYIDTVFTGIVEEAAEVVEIEEPGESGEGRRLGVAATLADDLARGQSISVNGACLTVETVEDGTFEVFLTRETLDRTYFDAVAAGDLVNLERALPADGRIDGHFVQGHVDGTADLVAVERDGDDREVTVSLPADLRRYVVEKGSIAVDGISLTVADLADDAFTVAVVPETHRLTNLSEKGIGDPVHLEVDLIGKYVERIVTTSDNRDPTNPG